LEMKYIEKSGYDQGLQEGKLEGKLEGKQEGLLEGEQKGLLEGEQKGQLNAKTELLYKLLVKKFSFKESDLSGILKDSGNYSVDELFDFAVDSNSYEEFLVRIK
ncbi:MAG: hypothetical protein JXR63_05425, partial [Spirochaetales bacterium]|nr:hypothetical protein [Spirochaetales bacterium]